MATKLYDLGNEFEQAMKQYNSHYNNNFYGKVAASCRHMPAAHQNGFMNKVIDAALEICGMTCYSGKVLEVAIEAHDLSDYTMQAVNAFLMTFKAA
jgi:hypothetical protein